MHHEVHEAHEEHDHTMRSILRLFHFHPPVCAAEEQRSARKCSGSAFVDFAFFVVEHADYCAGDSASFGPCSAGASMSRPVAGSQLITNSMPRLPTIIRTGMR